MTMAKVHPVTEGDLKGWFEVSFGDIPLGYFPTLRAANEYARLMNEGKIPPPGRPVPPEGPKGSD